MRYAEQERANLHSRGDSVIRGVVQAPADPRTRGALQAALGSAQALSFNITRSRPEVPADCQFLDQSYVAAVTQEGASTADLLNALSRGDANRVRMISQEATAVIDRGIGVANASLEQVSRTRGVNPSLRLEGGETSIIAQAQRLLAR